MRTNKNTFDLESAFVWGSWRKQIQQTFDKATPLIEKLSPKIDPGYIYYLLREQTYIAMNRANADQRKIEQSWVKLCHALESFLASVSGGKPSRQIKRALEKAGKDAEEEGGKQRLWVRPEELAPKPSEEILKELNGYADKLGLPRYEHIASEDSLGGRPRAGWTNDVAFAMERHFVAKLGTPNWKDIGKLLSCVPAMESISMGPKQIRQRLLLQRRTDRRPILSNMAYDLERHYQQWIKEGAKGRCPSFLHPARSCPVTFDTRLCETTSTRLAEDLHEKYR
jgi:hypothetical protein